MALLYGLLWRLLLVLVHVNRALISWLRVRLRSWKGRLWERAMAALLLPLALAGLSDHQKKLNPNPDGNANPVIENRTASRRFRWQSDGRSLEKMPVHIGLLVAEEEPSYNVTDIANLVVWCMAVGISYVSVYDNHGIFQKNNSRLLKEIVRQQQDLLGLDGSKYNVEFVCNGSEKHQHHVVSCRPTVKVLSPEDGKQSIVQAAQQLCRSVENKEKTSKDISVSMLDMLIRESKNIPDPELVVKFGPVDSTLGFLPWHIRLTEFISLPSHRNVSYEDLLDALRGTVPVSSVSVSDVQQVLKKGRRVGFTQKRVWTGGDSKPCCVPQYSHKDREPRRHSQPAHLLLLSYKKRTFQDFWKMLSKPRENCISETHTDVRRLSAYTVSVYHKLCSVLSDHPAYCLSFSLQLLFTAKDLENDSPSLSRQEEMGLCVHPLEASWKIQMHFREKPNYPQHMT